MVWGLVDDAAWRNGVLEHILDELKAGRLATADAVMMALVPQASQGHSTTSGTDRSTPDGAIAAMNAAIERGDVAAAAQCITEARASAAKAHAVAMELVEEEITARKLTEAIRARFTPEQAQRLIRDAALSASWLAPFRNARWSVDGNVAHMADNSERPYEPWMRMIRGKDGWQIELPAEDPAEAMQAAKRGEKTRRQAMVKRTALRKEVLAHIDQFKVPGTLLDALNPAPKGQPEWNPEQYAKQMEEKIAAWQKQQATQPAPTTKEAKEQGIGLTFMRLSVALARKNVREAAKYYYAAGEGGEVYVLRTSGAFWPRKNWLRLQAARSAAAVMFCISSRC